MDQETLQQELDQLLETFSTEEAIIALKARMRSRESNTEKMRRYRTTLNGKIKTREASKRYYYKKNNKHHPIYNPISTEN
jgi:hypothetical protein